MPNLNARAMPRSTPVVLGAKSAPQSSFSPDQARRLDSERGLGMGLPAALREAADKDLNLRVKRGELVPSSEFAQRLGISAQALSKALQSGRVFFLQSGATRLYPSFFFDPSQERRHLERVSKVLGNLPGGSKLSFFTTPRVSLGRQTPLQALQKGRLDDVLAAAQSFADH